MKSKSFKGIICHETTDHDSASFCFVIFGHAVDAIGLKIKRGDDMFFSKNLGMGPRC